MEKLVRSCILFDLDGTLVDTVPLCTDILNAMLADHGSASRLSRDETRPHITLGGPQMVSELLGDRCGATGAALTEFRARYAATPTPAVSLYPGARETLSALAGAGFGLAIWSNKPQELCEKVSDELGLTDLLGAVIGTGPETPLKPDTTGLDLALERLCGTRAGCCLVGDSEADYDAARAAGIPLVLVTFGYGDYGLPFPGAVRACSLSAVPGAVRAVLATPARA